VKPDRSKGTTGVIRHLAVACLTSLAALVATQSAGAQTYPDRPIKMVVPYTPGGQFDIHARLLAEKMGTTLGQPVVIENRPGAGTMLGAEAVARAKNDGYTLLFSGSNMFAILPHTYSKLPYTVGDFQTITTVSDLPMGLVVDAKKVPAGDIKEFIELVRANPGKIDFGSSGTGGAQHLLGELAKMRMGLEMNQVSFRGTPEVLAAMLGGHVPVAFDGIVAYLPSAGLASAGKGGPLRILGISSAQRLAAAPWVPTFAEAGYPDMTVSTRGGIVAPAGTPRPIINKLHDAIVTANSDAEIRRKVIEGAAVPRTSTPEEFDAMIKADSALWGEVVSKLNLKLN
jgi:tripartite-type tricarboxylate transporter receptor subunit TctC